MSDSIYAHLYLGNLKTDPPPIFRDISPEHVKLPRDVDPEDRLNYLPDRGTVPWPDGAVFAVCFTRERFPGAYNLVGVEQEPVTFFERNGWPMNFPVEHHSLPEVAKRECQIFPLGWETFNLRQWNIWRADPTWHARLREQSGVIHGFYGC